MKVALDSVNGTGSPPVENPAAARWRTLLRHPHFRTPADLPSRIRTRQRLTRSGRQTRDSLSDPGRALKQQRMQEILQNTTPHEREILRKLGFRIQHILRQAHEDLRAERHPLPAPP